MITGAQVQELMAMAWAGVAALWNVPILNTEWGMVTIGICVTFLLLYSLVVGPVLEYFGSSRGGG